MKAVYLSYFEVCLLLSSLRTFLLFNFVNINIHQNYINSSSSQPLFPVLPHHHPKSPENPAPSNPAQPPSSRTSALSAQCFQPLPYCEKRLRDVRRRPSSAEPTQRCQVIACRDERCWKAGKISGSDRVAGVTRPLRVRGACAEGWPCDDRGCGEEQARTILWVFVLSGNKMSVTRTVWILFADATCQSVSKFGRWRNAVKAWMERSADAWNYL